jgi:DNA polymerase-3 subunit delta
MIYKSYLIEQNINALDKNKTLFYGENLGLKNEFKNKIKKNNKDAEIINFTQEEIFKNTEIFFNEIINISLFERKKIYFINQASDKILDIIQEIETKLDDQKLYLFSDILEKKSKLRNYFEKSNSCIIIACYSDNEITIKNIIHTKLKGFNGLSPQNTNLILDNCNLDRIKLGNELDKIVTFFRNKNIDYDNLEKLLDTKINEDFNILKDVALKGNKTLTNKLLSDTVLDTEKNIFYLTLINQRLNKLMEIDHTSKDISLDDEINKMKPPIFWKDKPNFIEQAKKWNYKKISDALNKTYDLEIDIKSNSLINKNIFIKKLIVDICQLANS